MEPNIRVASTEILLEHHHDDGSWGAMQELPHGEPEHDGERSWLRRRIFRCEACNEEVAVTVREGIEPAPAT